ncbi:MAG: hypothetical protein AB8B58_12605 [Roseobacter sp.]
MASQRNGFFNHRPGSGPLERVYVVRQAHRQHLNLPYGETIEQAGYVDQLLSSSIGGQFYQEDLEYSRHPDHVPDQVFRRAGE